MFTQTHLLVGAALFAKPGARAVTLAGLAGALVPDTDVWIMFVIERLNGATGCEVFHYRYWETPWTNLQSVINSIPLYAAMTLLGSIGAQLLNGRAKSIALILLVFSLSSLLHVATDFLLHHDDARAQLLPFTNWIFRSPVSYWDPKYYGQIFAVAEICLGFGLVFHVGRTFAKPAVWVVLALVVVGYSGTIAASFLELAEHDRSAGSCQRLEAQRI